MTATNGRINFRLAKQAITMQMLLDRYQITGLRKSGDERVGECPICHAQGKRQFKANLLRNVFRCFVCNAQGDIIAFVKAIAGCATLADAGVKLRELFPQEIAVAEGRDAAAHVPTPAMVEAKPPTVAVDVRETPSGVFLRLTLDGGAPILKRAQELLAAHPAILAAAICDSDGTVLLQVPRL